MKYSKSQLHLISQKKPELIKKPDSTLNDAIVGFLKIYEVFVNPPKSNRAIDGAITVAVTGMAGANVGGFVFISTFESYKKEQSRSSFLNF